MEFTLARIELLYIEKDSVHWEMFKTDCMEKEKQQIIEAYLEGADYTNDEHVTLAKEYYNQKYNK